MQNSIRDRFERTRDQLKTWSSDTIEELQNRQKTINERRGNLLRQGEEVLDNSRGAVRNAEATVLETARSIIGRARETFGERADFLQRGDEALAEALVALRAGHRATLPIDGFDSLSVKKVVLQLDGLDFDDLRTIKAYEESNKNRKTLLATLDKLIAAAAPSHNEETEPLVN
ncbi:MAG: hypothetical protein VX498_01145 [Myxococcota bacterium]|nr:hypothetical protein [Myxococcota bacterium]